MSYDIRKKKRNIEDEQMMKSTSLNTRQQQQQQQQNTYSTNISGTKTILGVGFPLDKPYAQLPEGSTSILGT